jgi:tetratricopeptide (TPR) repeat protein
MSNKLLARVDELIERRSSQRRPEMFVHLSVPIGALQPAYVGSLFDQELSDGLTAREGREQVELHNLALEERGRDDGHVDSLVAVLDFEFLHTARVANERVFRDHAEQLDFVEGKFGVGGGMTRRVRRRAMLGFAFIVLVVVLAIGVAFTGLLGAWAKESVWHVWRELDAFAEHWYAWIDRLGKLAGLLITLGSGAYAIYQKLYFAEFNMHVRLKEFQERVEGRLKDSNRNIDKVAQRPGPSRQFESPIFTDEKLNPVLKRMKWGKRPKADESLQKTLDDLEKQLGLWDTQKKAYEQRKAQVCLLKGAIASARAAKGAGEPMRKDNLEALGYFEEAFALSKKSDTEALEYVGHQRVRLGEYGAAIDTFEELEAMAPADGPSLLKARALKFQGEVWECRKPQPNLTRANSVLIEAVKALPGNAPLLERAEINEMHGRVREKAGIGRATDSYTSAELAYQRIVDGNNVNDADVPIAQAGLERVRAAHQRIRLRPLQNDNSPTLSPPSGDQDQEGS